MSAILVTLNRPVSQCGCAGLRVLKYLVVYTDVNGGHLAFLPHCMTPNDSADYVCSA